MFSRSFLQSQLAAGDVDVMAFFIPHGNGDARLVDGIPEGAAAALRRAFPWEPLHSVVWNEVDLGVQALGDPDEMGCVVRESFTSRMRMYSSVGIWFLSFPHSSNAGNELGEGPFFVDRHDLVAHLVRGSVQGDGQTDLPGIGGQFFQAGNSALTWRW